MARIKFLIDYYAAHDEQLHICGSTPETGNFDETKTLALNNTYNNVWSAEFDTNSTGQLIYYYIVKQNGTTVRREHNTNRTLTIEPNRSITTLDKWFDTPQHLHLHSAVFTDCIMGSKTAADNSHIYKYARNTVISIVCPFVTKQQTPVICGENEFLGNWNPAIAPEMQYVGNAKWQIVLDADKLPPATQYKFVTIDAETRQTIQWEDGDNRLLPTPPDGQTDTLCVENGIVFNQSELSYRGAGTAIPLFSLRSANSFGIGDFDDLKKMIDWAAATKQQIIQLLPINDTTTTNSWRDSYPYNAISAFALHPIYFACAAMPLHDTEKMNHYRHRAETLNKLDLIDYDSVAKLKTQYLHDLFAEQGAETISSDKYSEFYNQNAHWLFSYSCFCTLRDKHGSAKFEKWGEFAQYDEQRLRRTINRGFIDAAQIDFHCFVQYLLHTQMLDALHHAQQQGIALKGDIPIGISPQSVEVWTLPSLFNLDTQTGAPPDDFSEYGQNWGFPTYNWPAMQREQYDWWKNRFRKMAQYFHAYRIDHILGFFRIWQIPDHAVQGLIGQFSPAMPYTAHEITEAGMPFDSEKMTKPFIHENYLHATFGDCTDTVKNYYLDAKGDGLFALKSFCDTQKKIAHLFDTKTDSYHQLICNGLLNLCNEVLFLKDHTNPNLFHPRIQAQKTNAYRHLDEGAQKAFDHLHNSFFYHRHNSFWHQQAMTKLPQLISSTNMMVCGEDLGMIPECVHPVMKELQILSLEIERMPKQSNRAFADLSQLPYEAVCTTSTHDMSPIRAWWLENPDLTQLYYNSVLGHEGTAPRDCTPELCRQIISNHLHSPAMWVIIPWQDWMSINNNLRRPDPLSERINIPANPNHYWRYRMHISLEDLIEQDDLNKEIEELVLERM